MILNRYVTTEYGASVARATNASSAKSWYTNGVTNSSTCSAPRYSLNNNNSKWARSCHQPQCPQQQLRQLKTAYPPRARPTPYRARPHRHHPPKWPLNRSSTISNRLRSRNNSKTTIRNRHHRLNQCRRKSLHIRLKLVVDRLRASKRHCPRKSPLLSYWITIRLCLLPVVQMRLLFQILAPVVPVAAEDRLASNSSTLLKLLVRLE